MLKEGEHFTWRSAASLVSAYKLEDELKPLLEAAMTERGYGPKRKELATRLTRHAETDLGGPIKEFQFFVCGPSAGAVQVWFMPHVAALFLPPLLWFMHRSRWRVSIRTLLLLLTLIAIATWLLADGWRFAFASPAPLSEIAGLWLNGGRSALPVLAVSVVLTCFGMRLLRSAPFGLATSKINEPA